MGIKWNRQVVEDTKREAARRLQRLEVFFTLQHQQRLGVPNPLPYKTPSVQGEYPRKRTEALIGGIIFAPTKVDDIIANHFKVRGGLLQNVWYGAYLENYLQRLGFVRTATDLKPQIRAIVQGGQT